MNGSSYCSHLFILVAGNDMFRFGGWGELQYQPGHEHGDEHEHGEEHEYGSHAVKGKVEAFGDEWRHKQ